MASCNIAALKTITVCNFCRASVSFWHCAHSTWRTIGFGNLGVMLIGMQSCAEQHFALLSDHVDGMCYRK